MPYSVAATTRAPGLVVLAVNSGVAMNEPFGPVRKIDRANELIAEVLTVLIQRSGKGEVITARYRVAIVCYGDSAWDVSDGFEPIGDLASRGQPILLTVPSESHAATAFTRVHELLQAELRRYDDSPAALVCHITDGRSADADATAAARRVMALRNRDGHALLMHVIVGPGVIGEAAIDTWPGVANEEDLGTPALRQWFRASSPLPDGYASRSADEGYSLVANRHMVVPADTLLVSSLMPPSAGSVAAPPDRPRSRDAVPHPGTRTTERVPELPGDVRPSQKFSPKPGDQLTIFDQPFIVSAHPAAPGLPYALEAAHGLVYRLAGAHDDVVALKVFKKRYRTKDTLTLSNRLNRLQHLAGCQAAARGVVGRDDPVTLVHPSLQYAVMMNWLPGTSWFDHLLTASANRARLYSVETALALARRFLAVMSGLEQRGLAHTDICAANVLVDIDACGVELVDLEGIYLPGAPPPVHETLGTFGYQHRDLRSTWHAAGDRYAATILSAELLLLAFDDAVKFASEAGMFGAPSDDPAAAGRVDVLEGLLQSHFPAFFERFRHARVAASLDKCPSIADLDVAIATDAQVPAAGARLVRQEPDNRHGEKRASPAKVFVSYSHKDSRLKNELVTHLKTLARSGTIETWTDHDIAAGSDWETQLQSHLDAADLVLLLVSPDFLASDYCYGREMIAALRRHEEGTARVIPILVRAVDWPSTPFRGLQAAPVRNGALRAVKDWANRDAAWLNVILAIRRAIGQ